MIWFVVVTVTLLLLILAGCWVRQIAFAKTEEEFDELSCQFRVWWGYDFVVFVPDKWDWKTSKRLMLQDAEDGWTTNRHGKHWGWGIICFQLWRDTDDIL